MMKQPRKEKLTQTGEKPLMESTSIKEKYEALVSQKVKQL